MSRSWATLLSFTFLYTQTALAQPPVRKFDDPGSPPFKVLCTLRDLLTFFSHSAVRPG